MEDQKTKQDFISQKKYYPYYVKTEPAVIRENEEQEINEELPNEIDNYLKQIKSGVDNCNNPKLKKEHQRLTDLLASYKRLTERLQKDSANSLNTHSEQISGSSKVIYPVLPEIYAVLRPDLYRDLREEEKKLLITKFAKKRYFTRAEKILPSHTGPILFSLQDRRQNEKDRFCKLVSNAHSRFHNPIGGGSVTPIKTVRKLNSSNFKVENVREKEIERVAKLFASTTIRDSKSYRRSNESAKTNGTFQHQNDKSLRSQGAQCMEEIDMCKSKVTFNQENINPQIGENMVKVGEYSPLNGNRRGKTTLGVGEHDEQRIQLTEERKREYKNLMAHKRNRNHEVPTVSRNEPNQIQPLPRMNSTSTQTDSEESSTSFQDNQQVDFDSPIQSAASSPQRRRPMEFSPREKLLSDLYGSPAITHFQAASDEREKQAIYAEALRKQIEEKKRLEEERKLRERQEEELIEKRVREQAERLRIEYLKEQNKKSDWMQQRQAQEEILRRRLKELELESIEFKKQERQKKLQQNEEQYPTNRRVLQRRGASQSSHSSVDSIHSVGGIKTQYPINRSTFSKSPILNIAPLLDSDSQHILSARANQLRRGYNEVKDETSLAAGAFALGPGVNLFSSDYLTGDENSPRTMDGNVGVSKSPEDKKLPLEGYVPSLGQISPRSVNSTLERRSPPSRYHAEQLLQAPIDVEIIPSALPQTKEQMPNRPSSPVVPALQTDMLLRNSKIVEDKRKEPSNTAIVQNQNRGGDPSHNRYILTHLGEFRRKLTTEHHLLEQRLKQNNS